MGSEWGTNWWARSAMTVESIPPKQKQMKINKQNIPEQLKPLLILSLWIEKKTSFEFKLYLIEFLCSGEKFFWFK